MGELVTLTDAARLAGVSERTIREWIASGRLHAGERGGKPGEGLRVRQIDTDDLRRALEDRRQSQTERRAGVETILARLDALEREVAALKRTQAAQDGRRAVLDRFTVSEALRGGEQHTHSPTGAGEHFGPYVPRPVPPASPGDSHAQPDTFPADLETVAHYAALHKLAPSTVNKAVASGRLPTVSPPDGVVWKRGRSSNITHALDAAGRQRFHDLWSRAVADDGCELCAARRAEA